MKKALKLLGMFIFVALISIQSVSATNLHEELAIDRNNINIQQQDSRSSVPLNTRGIIRGFNQHSIPFGTPAGAIRVGPWFGWDYAYMGPSASRIQTFTFVPTGNGRVVIRATSPNWSNYNYFNISNRGYVFLDRRANAREFVISPYRSNDDCTPNLCPNQIHFSIMDVRTQQFLGTFRWGGHDYVTIGSGTRRTSWTFTRS